MKLTLKYLVKSLLVISAVIGLIGMTLTVDPSVHFQLYALVVAYAGGASLLFKVTSEDVAVHWSARRNAAARRKAVKKREEEDRIGRLVNEKLALAMEALNEPDGNATDAEEEFAALRPPQTKVVHYSSRRSNG